MTRKPKPKRNGLLGIWGPGSQVVYMWCQIVFYSFPCKLAGIWVCFPLSTYPCLILSLLWNGSIYAIVVSLLYLGSTHFFSQKFTSVKIILHLRWVNVAQGIMQDKSKDQIIRNEINVFCIIKKITNPWKGVQVMVW